MISKISTRKRVAINIGLVLLGMLLAYAFVILWGLIGSTLFNADRAEFERTVKVGSTPIGSGVTDWPDWKADRYASEVIESPALVTTETWLRKALDYRHPLRVIGGSCRYFGGGTHYEIASRTIYLCSDATGDYVSYLRANKLPDRHQTAVLAGAFGTLHELGHALIHDEDVPVLGREEDAADAFAALVAMNAKQPAMVEAGAGWFASNGMNRSMNDPHSNNLARAGRLRCLAYGADPERGEAFARDAERDDGWRSGCIALYRNQSKAWNTLLKRNAFATGGVRDAVRSR